MTKIRILDSLTQHGGNVELAMESSDIVFGFGMVGIP